MLRHKGPAGALVLILLLFAVLVTGARELSFTADEPSHLASGYAFWACGLDALWTLSERGHPLLADAWVALPLFIGQPQIPLEQLGGWKSVYGTFVHHFMAYLEPLERSRFAGRVPEMLLTVLLAAIVYRWGVDLWGPRAGALALTALVLDPTLLAHGRLATNDVSVVTFGTAALYTAWRWMERPSWRWAMGTSALLWLTTLAKGSGIIWAAATGLAMLTASLSRSRKGPVTSLLLQTVVAGGGCLLLLWASYGFSWGYVRGVSFPLPAPAHWSSLVRQSYRVGERWVFALGQRKVGRWWWYFFLAFLIKNPLALLIGWLIGSGTLLRRSPGRARLPTVGLFSLIYAAVAVWKGLNIGYRHMLPIHPFLYLVAGGGLAQWAWGPRGSVLRRGSLAALGVWYAAATISVFPYEVAYFNELTGGPSKGYLYLADSNVAWGQAVHVAEAYAQTHPDVHAEPPISPLRPLPGRYVVNASYLHGIGLGDHYAYEWFRHWEPIENLAYSQLVYDVPPFEMGWFAQCDAPRVPLDEVSIAEGTGREDLRTVTLDCTQAWVFPGGGAEAGIYALDRELVAEPGFCWPSLQDCSLDPADPFIARRLAQARLSFEQIRSGHEPPFVLYEVAPGVVVPPRATVVQAPHDGLPSAASQATRLFKSPVSLDGPLVFLGSAARREEETLEVETWWRVTQGPIPRPFSIMGHLVAADGTVIGSSDGLGVSPLVLLPGDILVERHRFTSLPRATQAWFRTGVYWLDSMERWPLVEAPGVDSLLVPLAGDEDR